MQAVGLITPTIHTRGTVSALVLFSVYLFLGSKTKSQFVRRTQYYEGVPFPTFERRKMARQLETCNASGQITKQQYETTTSELTAVKPGGPGSPAERNRTNIPPI